MIERKPPPTPKRSLKSLEAGLALFPHFRKHISLSGPLCRELFLYGARRSNITIDF
jgi:hypothetical protein